MMHSNHGHSVVSGLSSVKITLPIITNESTNAPVQPLRITTRHLVFISTNIRISASDWR
jgi:hypothetical protein